VALLLGFPGPLGALLSAGLETWRETNGNEGKRWRWDAVGMIFIFLVRMSIIFSG
jgi:hypothetical protein